MMHVVHVRLKSPSYKTICTNAKERLQMNLSIYTKGDFVHGPGPMTESRADSIVKH